METAAKKFRVPGAPYQKSGDELERPLFSVSGVFSEDFRKSVFFIHAGGGTTKKTVFFS